MFRSSKNESQLNMFSSVSGMLRGKSSEQFNDPQAWHNMVRSQVVDRIDENIFTDLFNQKIGAPNASVKLLVGMMILKEAFGWSDSELYENCRFNLLARCALGLFNMHDSVPVESTYYLLRKRIHDYHKEKQVDLLEQVFKHITKSQALEFGVNGKSVRMDSKLIGSNIIFSSRYELVHNTLISFYKEMIKTKPVRLIGHDLKTLKTLAETTGNKIVYVSGREEVKKRLHELGILCHKVLSVYEEKDNKYYATLKRVFNENFRLEDNGQITMKPRDEIKSDSIQSPHDTECAYRNKAGVLLKGYSVNVSETCDDNSLNLVTDIQVAPANKSDTEFVIPALENTQEVLDEKPENLHADGAFNNQTNIKYCEKKAITPYFTGMAGTKGRYDLIREKNTLTVIDTETGEKMLATKTDSGKWKIKTGEKAYRYFTEEDIDRCYLRKQIAQIPEKIRNKRNNVEATIFLLTNYTRNNKTRYRGMLKNKLWAILRSIWINLKRIIKWMGEIGPKKPNINQLNVIKAVFDQKMAILRFFVRIFGLEPSRYRNLGITGKYRLLEKAPFRSGLND